MTRLLSNSSDMINDRTSVFEWISSSRAHRSSQSTFKSSNTNLGRCARNRGITSLRSLAQATISISEAFSKCAFKLSRKMGKSLANRIGNRVGWGINLLPPCSEELTLLASRIYERATGMSILLWHHRILDASPSNSLSVPR